MLCPVCWDEHGLGCFPGYSDLQKSPKMTVKFSESSAMLHLKLSKIIYFADILGFCPSVRILFLGGKIKRSKKNKLCCQPKGFVPQTLRCSACRQFHSVLFPFVTDTPGWLETCSL